MSEADDIIHCEDCLPPADAFAVVGDESRLGILEALWRLDTPVRFSAIHDEVDIEDSAQFNYHLGKLTDQFVRKDEAGYELRTAGERVVQSILAGSFTQHPQREIEIDDPCIRCGATLSATYHDELLTIECPDCGHRHGEYLFPPGGLHDRSDPEILRAFDQRVRHLHCLAKDGVCPVCSGRVDSSIEGVNDCCLDISHRAIHRCVQCDHTLCSAIGLSLLDQSPVVAFYEDQGVTLSETPYWQLEWCVDDAPVTVLEEDPWQFEIAMTQGDNSLSVVVDDTLSIVDATRS